MASVVGNLRVVLSAEAGEFTRGVKTAERQLLASAQRMSDTGRMLSRNVTLPLAAVGAAAVKLASDAQESASKFGTVFGAAASEMTGFINDVQSSIPATRKELQDMTSGLQDLLVPMGVIPREAVRMNQSFVRLAGDLASFNNLRITDVLNDLRSGIVGQSEPLLKYGIDVRAAAVNAKALELGLISVGGEMTNAARAAAVLAIATEQSTFAIGDAEKTAGSAANQFKFLVRDVKELGTEIGNVLLPVVVSFLRHINDMLKGLRELDPALIKVAVGLGVLAAAAGPVLATLANLIRVVTALKGAAALGGLAALLTPGGALLVGLGALAALLTLTASNTTRWSRETREAIATLSELRGQLSGFTQEQLIGTAGGVATSLRAVRAEIAEAKAALATLRERAARPAAGFGGVGNVGASTAVERQKREIQELEARERALLETQQAVVNSMRQLGTQATAVAGATSPAAQATRELADATAGLNMETFALHPALAEYARQMLELDKLERDNLTTKIDLAEANARLQATLDAINTDLAREQLEELREQVLQVQAAVHGMTAAIGRAVEDFILGTKTLAEAFREMVEEILRQLVRLAIQRLILGPLFGFLTGLFGGVPIPGRATGGPVQAGKPFLVGEQGPEVFVPGRSGSIVPNNQLAGGGGGPAVVQHMPINFTINAWDSRDVHSFFRQHGKAIADAVSEQSSRSLTTARKLTGGQ